MQKNILQKIKNMEIVNQLRYQISFLKMLESVIILIEYHY